MPFTILLHVANEEAILAEIDDLPSLNDQWVKISNPRRKDNKDLQNIMAQVTTVMYPTWRINFIEVMPSDDEEDVTTFVRESR